MRVHLLRLRRGLLEDGFWILDFRFLGLCVGLGQDWFDCGFGLGFGKWFGIFVWVCGLGFISVF